MKSVYFIYYALILLFTACTPKEAIKQKPNILFVISDDQSYPHASAYGYDGISTPGFDRIANEGVLFTNAYAPSPGCSPTRASILTGRHIWQIENAGTHASSFPTQYKVYTDLLDSAGYHVGYTGKGWSPGDYEISGRTRNPAGEAYNGMEYDTVPPGISNTNYAANFEQFLTERAEGQPFCFWMGGREPHRKFHQGIGVENGKDLDEIEVPDFLPDAETIRSDIADYLYEIEWFDKHLVKAIELLEQKGELDNTLIVVTSDNGMAFPRAKANLYEYGIHMPLAIRWGNEVKKSRTVDQFVDLMDLGPTFLEAAGVMQDQDYPMTGISLVSLLKKHDGDTREAVYSGRERHSSSRYGNLGYPIRSLRMGDYLYIRNFKPDRWPAGTPRKFDEDSTLTPMHDGYHDIDGSPSLDFLIEHADNDSLGKYLDLAVDKRPMEELYNISEDPGCIHNLADHPDYESVKVEFAKKLVSYLEATGDPRVTGNGDVFESYERLRGPMRAFPKDLY